MSSCPISLHFKDHKGWVNTSGKVPPTRHVAGGHVGLNLHLSELVSDLTEPLVGNIDGGQEIIFTEDKVGKFMFLNEDNEGWTDIMAWEGVTEDNVSACGKCKYVGQWEYN